MREQFADWLDGMDVVLDEFMHDLPKGVSSRLDYSIRSLDVLEAWLLDKYSSYQALREDPDVRPWDGAARYYGQVLIKHVGGEWAYNPDGPPYLRGFGLGSEGPAFVPMRSVSATIDRREGDRMRQIAEANLA